MTLHEFSDLKLEPIIQVADTDDAHIWQCEEDNDVRSVVWQKLHDKSEAWVCSFVRNQYRRVSAAVRRKLLPDYAPVGQKEKKKRETWVWLASVTVTAAEETQILQDGYYFFNLGQSQRYCETAVLMICDKLGIAFPDGASILIDKTGAPIKRHCRVVLPDGTEVNVHDFGWYKFYIASTDSDFLHSPLDWAQVRPTVKYLNAVNEWQSAPCSEVRALLYG